MLISRNSLWLFSVISYYLLTFVIPCVSLLYSIVDHFNIGGFGGSKSIAFVSVDFHPSVHGWSLLMSQHFIDVNLGKTQGSKLRIMFLLHGASGLLWQCSAESSEEAEMEPQTLPQTQGLVQKLQHQYPHLFAEGILPSTFVYCSPLPFQHFSLVLSCDLPLDLIPFILRLQKYDKFVLCRGYYFQARRPCRVSNLQYCQQWVSSVIFFTFGL